MAFAALRLMRLEPARARETMEAGTSTALARLRRVWPFLFAASMRGSSRPSFFARACPALMCARAADTMPLLVSDCFRAGNLGRCSSCHAARCVSSIERRLALYAQPPRLCSEAGDLVGGRHGAGP